MCELFTENQKVQGKMFFMFAQLTQKKELKALKT